MSRGTVKSAAEIEILKRGGGALAEILRKVVKAVQPGVTTKDLDDLAERLIQEAGGKPAFKGYNPAGSAVPYPAALCVSVNDEVVHAIPRRSRVLANGDIVGLDIGMRWPAGAAASDQRPATSDWKLGAGSWRQPLVTDMAVTVPVGDISEKAKKLLRVTEESLYKGVKKVRAGARIGDIGAAIQAHIEKHGFGVVRDLAGHGVGYQLHEEPLVPNFGSAGGGVTLREGMVIAIEPMATEGHWAVRLDKDEWTFRTIDGKLAAHFEHTVVVTDNGGLIVTQ